MKLFAVLLLAVYTTQCVLADMAADIKEVDSMYNDSKSDLQKKYMEFRQWGMEKLWEALTYFPKSERAACSDDAMVDARQAFELVDKEVRAKGDSIAAEMKREHDEAVEKIKEESACIDSGFNLKNMMAEGFKYMTGKANEFNELRKAFSDKLDNIYYMFEMCLPLAQDIIN